MLIALERRLPAEAVYTTTAEAVPPTRGEAAESGKLSQSRVSS
ncbi:hypothetical protein ACFV9D_01585 [Streptomyces sp. NPDC059875]